MKVRKYSLHNTPKHLFNLLLLTMTKSMNLGIILASSVIISSLFFGFLTYANSNPYVPKNCIQYTDECGNMCIKKRNNSWSCEKRTCDTPQQMMCVAETNDVDLDDKKNKIIKAKYVPQAFWPSITTNTSDISNNQTSNDTTNTTTPSCNSEKAVCGMIPLVCTKAPCFPIIQNYKNECIAKSEWALYIQRWSCSVKKNIKKRTVSSE